MLVLTRKTDQIIRIGTDITIKVIRVSGGRVRLAIDAPQAIRIARGELLGVEEVHREPALPTETFLSSP